MSYHKRETLADIVRRNRHKRKRKGTYTPYEKIEVGKDIPELADIKAELIELAEEGIEPELTKAQRDKIAYRYAQGIARVKPFVTGDALVAYLGLHLNTIRQVCRRSHTNKLAEKIQKEARKKQ